MKEIVAEYVIESLKDSVPDYENYNIVLMGEVFSNLFSFSFSSHELGNEPNYFEFCSNRNLQDFLATQNQEFINSDERFNKIKIIYFKNGEIKIDLTWDQIHYDTNNNSPCPSF